jgi:hypothetical protein
MPAASESDLPFEIGHVLFIDIVGYSNFLISEQSNQIQKLREIVRGTEQFRLAEEEGKLMRLPTGGRAPTREPLSLNYDAHAALTLCSTSNGEPCTIFWRCSSVSGFFPASLTLSFHAPLSDSLVSHFAPAMPTRKAPANAGNFKLISERRFV